MFEQVADADDLIEDNKIKSKDGGEKLTFVLINNSKKTLLLNWIDFEGNKLELSKLEPSKVVEQETMVDNYWALIDAADDDEDVLAAFAFKRGQQIYEVKIADSGVEIKL